MSMRNIRSPTAGVQETAARTAHRPAGPREAALQESERPTSSSRQSRSYSSFASTTTAGRPRRVTIWGSPAMAAFTTALNLFFRVL